MRMALSRIYHPVTTLGPGRRVGIWFQGCSIRCPGCISLDTWQPDAGFVDTDQVVARLAELAPDANGLTVSGGEPFDQPEALAIVLRAWRTLSGTSVLVFTGRELDDVRGWVEAHPALVDALMTGPFRSDLTQTRALRGSDNQRLHILTDRGAPFHSYERETRGDERRLDIMFDADGAAWLAGIPARGDMARLIRVLAVAGHHAQTSG